MKKSVFLAGLVAAIAIGSAPMASASPDDDTRCGKRGGASGCNRPGHSSLHVEPNHVISNGPPAGLVRPGWLPGYGGPALPVID